MRRLLLAVFALSFALVGPASAATAAKRGRISTLTVSSSATVTSAPDIANVSIELDSTNDKAADATGTINAEFTRLVGKLAPLGVKASDLHTNYFNVAFVPKPMGTATPSPWGPQPGYTARRSLTIQVRELANIGHVVDAAVASGAKQISGVGFALRDDEKAHNQALSDAVHKARASANAMAAAAGMHIGRVLAITSGYSATPMYQPRMLMSVSASAVPAPPTQIDAQSLTVTASVTITYALAP